MAYKMFFFNRFHMFVLVRISSLSGVRNAEVVSSILIRSTNQCERRSSGRRSRTVDDLTDRNAQIGFQDPGRLVRYAPVGHSSL